MKSLNILLVTSRFEHGGIGEVVHNEAIRLARNHDVTIAAYKFLRPTHPKINTVSIVGRWFSDAFDIVHVHGHSPIYLPFVSLRTQGFIITHHGLLPDQILGAKDKLKKVVTERLFIRMVRRATLAIGVCQKLVAELRLWGAKKPVLLYNGVDTTTFRPCINSKVRELRSDAWPILLFVGSLQPVRGLEDILYLLPFMVKRYSRLKFIIVGHSVSGYAEFLRKLARSLGINKHVDLVGYVPHEKLVDYYNACDLFVFPSLTYQLGLSVIEALACGKRVLLRDNGDPDARYLLSKGACYSFKNVREIPQILEQVLHDNETNIAGLLFAKSLDWKIHVSKLLEIYKNLVN